MNVDAIGNGVDICLVVLFIIIILAIVIRAATSDPFHGHRN